MRLISRIAILLVAGIIGITGSLVLAQSSSPPDPWVGLPWSEVPVMKFGPGDLDPEGYYVQKTEAEFADYMWRSFIALMWPTGTQSGQPGANQAIVNGNVPVAWETQATPAGVFIGSDHWSDYPDWPGLPPKPWDGSDCSYLAGTPHAPPGTKYITLRAVNLPSSNVKSPVGPLPDVYSQNPEQAHYVRGQVTMNKRYFNYVKKNRYYNAARQTVAVKNGTFVPLPYDDMGGDGHVGMIETKAAWMVLVGAKLKDLDRYYTRWAYLVPSTEGRCSKALVGLVAFHIHRLNKLSHAAATFEQVDNVTAPTDIKPSFNPNRGDYGQKGYSGDVPAVIDLDQITKLPAPKTPISNISRATPILARIKKKNLEYQGKVGSIPGNSVSKLLKYYQLIGTQHAAEFCGMKIVGGKKVWKSTNPREACPTPNVHALINVALEPNTQLWNPQTKEPESFSCQGCHSYARPCCTVVKNKDPRFQVMSYLLSKARFPGQGAPTPPYTCSEPPALFQKKYCGNTQLERSPSD